MNTENPEPKNTIHIRPYTLSEISAFYKVHYKTLKRWLSPFKDEIGQKNGKFYSIKQVEIIFKKLSFPYDEDIHKE
ncbi:MAG: hypothetical protein WC223_05125 [Bacteroidales bacterium]|jgi:transposase